MRASADEADDVMMKKEEEGRGEIYDGNIHEASGEVSDCVSFDTFGEWILFIHSFRHVFTTTRRLVIV